MPTIPIRVMPGSTELYLDASTKAYHLNVGFNLNFSVKELMEAIATLDQDAVDIKMQTSVPVNRAAQPQIQTPVPQGAGLQGEFRPRDAVMKEHAYPKATWETKLHEITKATQDYRQKVSYLAQSAKYFRIPPEPAAPAQPAQAAAPSSEASPAASVAEAAASGGETAAPAGGAAGSGPPPNQGAPPGSAQPPGGPGSAGGGARDLVKDDCKTQ